MFTPINRLPNGVVGFEASGRVTSADSRAILAPAIAAARRSGDKVKLLYVNAPDFVGYAEGEPLDAVVFGTEYFTDFERIAFVGSDGPHARAFEALEGLMPAELRRFCRCDIDRAKAWLAG